MRISFRNRNLGYPVLFPEPRDYTAGGFDIEPPQAYGNAAGVSLRIAYRLDSAYLTSLVAQGDAELRTLIVGDGAFLREATPPTDQLIQQHTLDRKRWAGTVEMMTYLTATKRITGFASAEHDQEFGLIAPDGFTIEPAMILAVGNVHEVDIDETAGATSVIDVQSHLDVSRGEFRIDLAQPRIIVYVAPDDFTLIDRAIGDLRDVRRQSLWPSIYLLVISEGIRKLPDYREDDYAWTRSVERALHQSGYDPEDAVALRNNALEYAQRIIYDEKKRYPLGMMLDAFAAEDVEPQDVEL